VPPLSVIYEMLNNPFYFGEFEYGGKWYMGTHEPLMSKRIFEKVQIQLKKVCKCGNCGGSITAEVKYRRSKANTVNTHIYYHCNRMKDYRCREPVITEEELIKQLIDLLPHFKLDTRFLWNEFKTEIKRLDNLQNIMIKKQDVNSEKTEHNTGKLQLQAISRTDFGSIGTN
jgi:hypothetical protein